MEEPHRARWGKLRINGRDNFKFGVHVGADWVDEMRGVINEILAEESNPALRIPGAVDGVERIPKATKERHPMVTQRYVKLHRVKDALIGYMRKLEEDKCSGMDGGFGDFSITLVPKEGLAREVATITESGGSHYEEASLSLLHVDVAELGAEVGRLSRR